MSQPVAINIRDLDPNIRDAFKSVCSRRGRTMKGILVAFMKEVSTPQEDPKKSPVSLSKLSLKYRDPK